MNRPLAGALALVLAATLAACGPSKDRRDASPAVPSESPTTTTPAPSDDHHAAQAKPAKAIALRPGEHRMTLTMPEAYTPSAPNGVGTDDYRCFLLDPKLTKPMYLTGTNVLPGNPTMVHHVILFQTTPDQVGEAEAKDASEPGEGWTCFGGTGLSGDFGNVDDANWLGAWAPGGQEAVTRPGYGVRLEPGSRIIMQVHYNLLAADENGQSGADTSATQLRWRPASANLTPIHTVLEPAPVELPCRKGHDQSPLCDRDNAVADVKARFGAAGNTADLLYLLCGGKPHPSQVTSCTRPVQQGMTILGVAGHMHLLGRKITIVTNPGTPRAKTILDIPIWDFDNQGAKPIPPVHLDTWDTVKVTCKHVQWLRDRLPSFQDQPERYVVWGEGTTDEMCLGMLQVALDAEKK
jgi:hypothetical protein